MKYYKLLYDYEHSKDAVFIKKVDINDMNRHDTEEGNVLQVNENDLIFELDINKDSGYRETDYLCNELSWFIVSERTKSLFEKFQKVGLQFIKVNIKNLNIINKYFLVNILNLEDVLDLNNCKYDEFELDDGEKVISIEKYSVFENKIKNNIFRILGDTHPIFISEELKKAIEDEKLTGFDFLELKKNKRV